MPNHPPGNGRNVALPDENRPSWRPQDEISRNRRMLADEDERMRYGHWEDRERGDWDHDERWPRPGEHYGSSGYGHYGGDRSFESRNSGYPGSFEERQRERSGSYYQERYHPDRGREPERFGSSRNYSDDRPNLGTGGTLRTTYPEHTGYSTRPDPVPSSGYRGKGPANYQRTDERIRETVCEVLTEDDRIDATHIEVDVKNGEVFLTGSVEDRQMKRLAEDVIEHVAGVKDVQNQIRVLDRQRSRNEPEVKRS